MGALDHGMLNLPLGHKARGGSIDSQIDRYKREQAAADRAEAKARFHSVCSKRARVKELLRRIGDWRIMQLAKPLSCRKPSSARAKLAAMANSNLDGWIRSLEREDIPAGGCAACWAPVGECQHDAREWLGGDQ